jgi:hypothetical protein
MSRKKRRQPQTKDSVPKSGKKPMFMIEKLREERKNQK